MTAKSVEVYLDCTVLPVGTSGARVLHNYYVELLQFQKYMGIQICNAKRPQNGMLTYTDICESKLAVFLYLYLSTGHTLFRGQKG